METVLITGASRGIGLALARACHASGRRVIATCRDPVGAHALQAMAGPDFAVEALDIADSAAVRTLAGRLSGETIDILFQNAGVYGGDRQSRTDMDADAWLETLRVSVIAPFEVATAFEPHLKRSTSGRLVALSSQMGSIASTSTGAYAYRSAKAALNRVLRLMALELAGSVIVVPVHPGWVRTDMGGSGADISADESAAGLLALADRLTPADSGRFWNWDGRELPW
jgi:NAD(P)-dependent dehydrogenase (short-subunit alcohol dehydrogenase family)